MSFGRMGAKGGFGSLGGPGIVSNTSPYYLNDLASRYADNAVMAGARPLIGPVWSTTGAANLTVIGSKFLCTTTGTGYLVNTLAGTPQSICAELDWSGGTDLTQKGMTIAFADSSGTFLNDLLHLNFSPVAFGLTVRQAGGAFNSILSGNWKSPMTNDGTTHTIALAISGQKVAVLDPSGDLWSGSDSRVPSVLGPRVMWEPLLQADGLQARVSKTYAYKSLGFTNINFTSINPSDISAGLTLSNNNQTIARAGSISGSPQARTIDAITNTKFYFETSLDIYGSPSGQFLAIGIASLGSHNFSSFIGQDLNSLGIWMGNNTDVYLNNAPTRVITGTTSQGDVFGFALDVTAQKLWVQNVTKATGFNPALGGTQNPATGQGGFSFSTLTGAPFAIDYELDGIGTQTLNSGQMPYTATRPAGFGNALV